MVMRTKNNDKKIKRPTSGRYARTEEELYRKAIQLLEKCKVED
jgi:hypothetical protein